MLSLDTLVKTTDARKRVGRGGSRGGTSGRGHKGQRSRSGGKSGLRANFEGGQMPLTRRLPRRGFNNTRFADKISEVQLSDLELKFEIGETVNKESLISKRIVRRKNTKVKILGGRELTKKLIVTVDAVSASAREAITKVGGEVTLTGE
ncbi:50S ribosomal protein L15 [bacterium]|nr:50S ribosomal protein L15 [bacterium]